MYHQISTTISGQVVPVRVRQPVPAIQVGEPSIRSIPERAAVHESCLSFRGGFSPSGHPLIRWVNQRPGRPSPRPTARTSNPRRRAQHSKHARASRILNTHAIHLSLCHPRISCRLRLLHFRSPVLKGMMFRLLSLYLQSSNLNHYH